MRHDMYRRTAVLMGTFVTIEVSGDRAAQPHASDTRERVERAFEWFRRIEECCSRFDRRSELRQLTAQIGVTVPVSAILYEAVQFAVAVAEETSGAFDPTVGFQMERNGFNQEHRTRKTIRTDLAPGGSVSYRDIRLDPGRRAVMLLRPLILDLGAVAKGLAIDMAARELQACGSYAIDAGGDLYLGGCRPDGAAWSVGIRHPRRDAELIDSIRVSNRAVCTSGDYERRSSGGEGGHHILDPRTGRSASDVASVTVVAPTAMLADAVATAAFVLGPADGIRLFDRLGVDGLILSPALERFATRGMGSDYDLGKETAAAMVDGGSPILPNPERPAHHRSGGADGRGRAGRRYQAGGAGPL
jgi:thiamine biosynthesis lipoprotein